MNRTGHYRSKRTRSRRSWGLRLKWSLVWMGLGSLGLFAGCRNGRTLCYQYQSTPIEGWEQHSLRTFQTDTVSEEGNYELRLGLRTTATYPFQSIWLSVRQEYKQPDTVIIDTVSIVLTDAQGHPAAKGIALRQSVKPVRTVSMKKGGSATITVGHIMRRTLLPGIADVGIDFSTN